MTRPNCFEFAMNFLGGKEEEAVRKYVEQLESALAEEKKISTYWYDVVDLGETAARKKHKNSGSLK